MRRVILISIILGAALFGIQQSSSTPEREKTVGLQATAEENSIKVTITTGGGLYGPVKSQFKVGEDIPVVITLTNTGDRPAKYCLSTSLFQNRPQLRSKGQLMPYLTKLPQQTENEDAIQRCERSAARQFPELQPKQTRVVDWFPISQRGIAWYEALPAGHYELVLMRRIECCQGPLVKSNKVAFEVVP